MARGQDQDTPIAEAIGVSKRYGPTTALLDIHLQVYAGESHALVGRNGAGKSTLVAVLTGLRSPDAGEIRFDGLPAPPIQDRRAWRERVACVYQHSTIIPDLTVGENLFINRQPTRGGLIGWSMLHRQARDLLDQWNIDVSERARAGDLKVETRQLVEIARALSYGARFIILDEPTAQLDGEEIKRLFRRIRELQAAGVTFLFISHHLQEVYQICQVVTVLRDARHIVTCAVAKLPTDRLIEAMTGETASVSAGNQAMPALPRTLPVALEVEDLSGEDFVGVSLQIRKGEVVGIAGATSSGRIGVAEAVAGLVPWHAGVVLVDGQMMVRGNVPRALAVGIGCVPKSRHKQGLVLSQSVADNITMTASRRLGPLGFLVPRRKRELSERSIRALGVVTQGYGQLASALSGGNQQKVVMGRALATDPEVLVLMDPTAGVDVKSKEALLAVIQRMRDAGKAILVASGELEDLRSCDRVLVMRQGSIVAEHPSGWTDTALVASIEGL